MLKEAIAQMKIALILLLTFTVITGILYPLTVTGIAQLLFSEKANGSLIKNKDNVIGSRLIGQSFSSPAYFWGRPSATNPYPYNGEASSGSNLGPTNPIFLALVKERIQLLTQGLNDQLIPVDLVTASGSGLDPDISPYAALYQATRVAKKRNLPEEDIKTLIRQHIQPRILGLLGEPRINVLELNLALNNLGTKNGQSTPKS